MATFLSTLITPAQTALNSPVSQELITVPGKLVLLRLYVPPGPRGELYLRLIHGGVQLAPARQGTWWRPDDDIIDFPLDFTVISGDVKFYLQGASPNANFQHSVDFELTIETNPIAATNTQAPSLTDRIRNLLP